MAKNHSKNTMKALTLIGDNVNPVNANFIATALKMEIRVARSLIGNAFLRGELLREKYDGFYLYRLSALGHTIVFNKNIIVTHNNDIFKTLLFFYRNTTVRCKPWEC